MMKTRLVGLPDLYKPYFKHSDTDFARWIKTLKLLGIKYEVERESEDELQCLHKKIILTDTFYNASYSHQISVLFKTDNNSPNMVTNEFDKFELSNLDRLYVDMPSDMDLVYTILLSNDISIAENTSSQNLYKVIWVCDERVDSIRQPLYQDLYFEFYNANQDGHKENSLVGIHTNITSKEKLHPNVTTELTDETKFVDASVPSCGVKDTNIDATIYTGAERNFHEPTDYERWTEFLSSMNITYTEDEDSHGNKSIEIEHAHILSGSYAYVRLMFHGWNNDEFAGFESNDS